MAKKVQNVIATYRDDRKPKGYPFIWTKEYQESYDGMKAIMIQDALIAYPKYGGHFDVHTDDSDY